MSKHINADKLAYMVACNGDVDFINKVTKLMVEVPSIDIVFCKECKHRPIKEDVDGTSAQLDQALDDLQGALEQVGINKATLEVVVQRLNAMVADYDASAEQEILDARVGHNGVTYGSMGEAIRGQFDELRVYVDSEGYVCQNSST